ncbi:MAG: class I SAM-dependent methyltransferase [Desulfobacter sp.]|nr:MAG: class I SAM-dependent methyltransferase [Desulfobacter sp.]
MTLAIKEERFWNDAWQSAASQSKAAKGKNPVKRWDKMAKDFAQRTSGEKASARREQTIALLLEKGILTPEARVLDIGAGPGSWALPLSRHCGHVTALEPSTGMTQIMGRRIKEEGVENITIDQRTWQEVDISESGWEKAFDLVFASMTPGIDGPVSLKKMVAASRGYCYMSAFSGPGMHQQFAPLWEKFFGTPMPDKPNDIIYPFNLLYAMGFRPDLHFSWWNREINWDRDHTIRHFTSFFETHMEITEAARAQIADYVDTLCPAGEYRPAKPVCRGAMIWSVNPGGGNDI